MTIAPPSDDKGSWELFCHDGEMKLYTREVVTSDGMVVDPLRAVHTVQGTVHYCHAILCCHPMCQLQTDGKLNSKRHFSKRNTS